MITATLSNNREIKITQWFSEYGKRLVGFIRSKVDNLTEAEDIAQDVWFQLTRQQDIDEIEQIGSWLFTTAKNKVFNFYKKKKSVPFSDLNTHADDTEMVEDSDSAENLNFDQWVSDNLPHESIETNEFWKKLDGVLQTLPKEQREVFIANELNDISFKELSSNTGIPINTLLARKRYAVLKLREFFENDNKK